MNDSIRNFCIIAHIDHGKSTLADRFLEITGTVSKREMKDQMLDQMDLERERGITIKLQPVRMEFRGKILNLIDTPGHVDFTYEVSRSLAAVEGVILLVDATQGIEAQTLANLYLAIDQDLTIIPVINKIDLPNADIERVRNDLVNLIGCQAEEVLTVSAKTGDGVEGILQAVIDRVPVPKGSVDDPTQFLIFDSLFDEYKGVIVYGRVFSGKISKGDRILLMASKKEAECLDVGYFKPKLVSSSELKAGDIGYIVSGLKDVQHSRVGDTITVANNPSLEALHGYQELKPMVFAGIFCKEGDDYARLREGINKIALSDASLTFEPDHSDALGFGFSCGFLGLLHLDIFQERLAREYNLKIVVTAPSVGYRVVYNDNGFRAMQKRDKSFKAKQAIVTSPLKLPDASHLESIQEPWMLVDIVTPAEYIGSIMSLVKEKRGVYIDTEYIDSAKAILHYQVPLASILIEFYDKLKSVSSGYASMNYTFLEYRVCSIQKLDIIVAGEIVEALASIVNKDEAYRAGRKVVDNLKDILPRQQFEVKIQAAVGGTIIAASRIPPMRKDVTANLYGGDVTRKKKLLSKQKKGKKRLKSMGKVDIPQEAFLAILKR